MIATISADIVRSTSLSTEALIKLRKNIEGLFDTLEKKYSSFWARIVRGDSIECFVPEYKYSLRIAILIKLFVKMQVWSGYCDEELRRFGIRFSIGIADIRYADKYQDIIDGPAIYMSGRNLDEISRMGNAYTAFQIMDAPREFSNFMDSYVALLSNLVDTYSAKQAEVVFYKLLGYKEVEISEKLGIYQSSVNTRSTNAQWGLVNTAIKGFEELVLRNICG